MTPNPTAINQGALRTALAKYRTAIRHAAHADFLGSYSEEAAAGAKQEESSALALVLAALPQEGAAGAEPVAWNCIYPKYGHFTLKKHEAEQAALDGATVHPLYTQAALSDHPNEYQRGLLDGIELAAGAANGVEPSLLAGMSERYVSIYCTARRDASDLIRSLPTEPCEYCGEGKRSGLPSNACENCMNTGLKFLEFSK
jgi:hypothetical protein